MDADEARRPGKYKKGELSLLVTLGVTDAQYLAYVAETDGVPVAYKRRRSERRRLCWHAGVGPVG